LTRPPRHSRARARRATATAALGAVLLVSAPAHAAEGLNLYPDIPSSVVILVAFLVLMYPLNVLLFRPLFRVLDERHERISGAHRRADKLQREAEEVLARYRDAVGRVREEAEQDRRAHVEQAREEHASITGQARQEAEQQVERSRADVRRSLEEARQGLRAQAETLARDVAGRVLGRSVS